MATTQIVSTAVDGYCRVEAEGFVASILSLMHTLADGWTRRAPYTASVLQKSLNAACASGQAKADRPLGGLVSVWEY